MSAPVFVVDTDALADSSRVVLDGDEGRHAAVVRRIGVGEEVELTDGAGLRVRCVVVAANRQRLDCEVRSRVSEPAPAPRVVVVQALAKGDRGELAVETMTEVGVDEIVPWSAGRSIVQWRGDRGAKSVAKWRGTAREAAKQSRRAWFPAVGELASTSQVAERLSTAAVALVLHEAADEPLASIDLPAAGDIVVVVGPEGGVAPDELAAFEAAGARPVRLGPSVLRTSTAGAVAAGVLLSRTARWS